VRLLSSDQTRWWTNFGDEPTPVEIEIARVSHAGHARLLRQDSEQFRDGVRRFLTALPRDAMVYSIGLDRDRRPREEDIAKASGHVILVEIELANGTKG